jgi:peptide/nickel transport system permease protein
LPASLARRPFLSLVLLVGSPAIRFLLIATPSPSPLQGQSSLHAYAHWLAGLPSGRSLTRGLVGPIWPQLGPALAHTLVLLVCTGVLVVGGSLVVGTITAARRGSFVDLGLRAASYLAWAVPPFLLALLVAELASTLGSERGIGPLPIAGWPGSCPVPLGLNAGSLSPCAPAGHGIQYVVSVAEHMVLPTLALGAGFIGFHARLLRSSLVTSLAAPYTTTAHAKGVPSHLVLLRHALRNSLSAFLAALTSDFGALFGAALAIDWIFQLNGLGTLFIREFTINDLEGAGTPVDVYAIEALLLVTALLLLGTSLIGEAAVATLDPRTRRD